MSCLWAARISRVPQTLSIAKRRESLKHVRGQDFYRSTLAI
jgi:hypothetical protein